MIDFLQLSAGTGEYDPIHSIPWEVRVVKWLAPMLSTAATQVRTQGLACGLRFGSSQPDSEGFPLGTPVFFYQYNQPLLQKLCHLPNNKDFIQLTKTKAITSSNQRLGKYVRGIAIL